MLFIAQKSVAHSINKPAVNIEDGVAYGVVDKTKKTKIAGIYETLLLFLIVDLQMLNDEAFSRKALHTRMRRTISYFLRLALHTEASVATQDKLLFDPNMANVR